MEKQINTELNGVLFTHYLNIVEGYVAGEYPLETAREWLLRSFPASPKWVDDVCEDLKMFTPGDTL